MPTGGGGRIAQHQSSAGFALLAADTFTRADSSSTLGSPETGANSYVARTGTWGITSNKAYAVTISDGDIATLDVGQTNQDISVDVNAIGTAGGGDISCGIIASWSSSTQYYLLQLHKFDSKVQLYKNVGGSFTLLGEVASGGGSTGTLRLVSKSASQVAYWNGSAVITTSDSAVTRGNHCGFRYGGANSNAATWDTLTVYDC